jgi:hypothetical protein
MKAILRSALAALMACAAAGCGGTAIPANTPPSLPAMETVGVIDGVSGVNVPFGTIASGVSGAAFIQSGLSVGTPIIVTFSSTPPAGVPTVQALHRKAEANGAPLSALAYFSITPSAAMSFIATPIFTLSSTTSLPVTGNYYAAQYDPVNGWTTLLGPGFLENANTVTFTADAIDISYTAATTYTYAIFNSPSQLATPTPKLGP